VPRDIVASVADTIRRVYGTGSEIANALAIADRRSLGGEEARRCFGSARGQPTRQL